MGTVRVSGHSKAGGIFRVLCTARRFPAKYRKNFFLFVVWLHDLKRYTLSKKKSDGQKKCLRLKIEKNLSTTILGRAHYWWDGWLLVFNLLDITRTVQRRSASLYTNLYVFLKKTCDHKYEGFRVYLHYRIDSSTCSCCQSIWFVRTICCKIKNYGLDYCSPYGHRKVSPGTPGPNRTVRPPAMTGRTGKQHVYQF